MESRTQGSRPRPRTQKKSEAKDSLSEDRHSRGQGQECSRPRPRTKETSASALQKKKKKVFTKIFQAISTKKRFPKKFSSASQNFNNSKNTAVLEPRTGQFLRTWGLEAKAKDFKMCPRGRPRGQGRPRGLHLCCLAQNVRFFFLEKFSGACHANSCFRYHKYYPTLHEDNVKNFAIFLLWLFWKSFSFLAGVVSKIFANKNTFATNHNGN